MANWVTASGRTLSYLYDLAGNRTRISWPDGYFHAYVYDPLNRVSQVQENGATSGPGLLAAYTYDNRGVRITLARAGGAGASTTANGSDGSGGGWSAWGTTRPDVSAVHTITVTGRDGLSSRRPNTSPVHRPLTISTAVWDRPSCRLRQICL